MTLKKYIRNKKVKHFTYRGVEVFIKDPLPKNINFKEVLELATSKVPSHLLYNLDSIYVGQFQHLVDRELQAVYRDSSIYMSNDHIDASDMLDDLLHEIAHSVEGIYGNIIYSDGRLEDEFLLKREKMWISLKNRGFEAEFKQFLNPKYSSKFDKYLYAEVGYPVLSTMLSDIFYSPYAATSLREYFANGFEAFFMREDVSRLKRLSPVLFNKMGELLDAKYN